jgi:hypothetical protein
MRLLACQSVNYFEKQMGYSAKNFEKKRHEENVRVPADTTLNIMKHKM